MPGLFSPRVAISIDNGYLISLLIENKLCLFNINSRRFGEITHIGTSHDSISSRNDDVHLKIHIGKPLIYHVFFR